MRYTIGARTLTRIAEAIRSKTSKHDSIATEDMAEEIRTIPQEFSLPSTGIVVGADEPVGPAVWFDTSSK